MNENDTAYHEPVMPPLDWVRSLKEQAERFVCILYDEITDVTCRVKIQMPRNFALPFITRILVHVDSRAIACFMQI